MQQLEKNILKLLGPYLVIIQYILQSQYKR